MDWLSGLYLFSINTVNITIGQSLFRGRAALFIYIYETFCRNYEVNRKRIWMSLLADLLQDLTRGLPRYSLQSEQTHREPLRQQTLQSAVHILGEKKRWEFRINIHIQLTIENSLCSFPRQPIHWENKSRVFAFVFHNKIEICNNYVKNNKNKVLVATVWNYFFALRNVLLLQLWKNIW